MAYEAGIEVRQGLSRELSWTLRRLEAVAMRPVEELGEAPLELQRLQYSLHQLAERLVGLHVPSDGGAGAAHAELADALACARDATAELAEAAAADGWSAAAPLVYEWRGAIFRVRLAQGLLAPARPQAAHREPDDTRDLAAALTAFGLTLSGGAAFVSGAVLASWPLWSAGMIAVVAGLLVYRP